MMMELSTSINREDKARAEIGSIFKMFEGIYKSAYRKKYDLEPPEGLSFEDQQRFIDEQTQKNVETFLGLIKGYSAAELRKGLTKLHKYPDWPPNMQAFLLLCRPEIEPVKAYREAVDGLAARGRGEMGNWSQPAIFWAASSMHFDLTTRKYDDIKEDWKAALELEREKGAWEAIPKPPLQIEMSPSPNNRKNCEKLLQDIGGGQIFKRKDDEFAWAHDVLKNPNATVSMVSMANEALGKKHDL